MKQQASHSEVGGNHKAVLLLRVEAELQAHLVDTGQPLRSHSRAPVRFSPVSQNCNVCMPSQ